MLPLKRLLLAASMCCLVATANAAPMDDAMAAGKRGDYGQALKIFRSLAAQGDARAQNSLGYMYLNGQGVTQDHQEAAKWYRLAAAKGFSDAQYNLGLMYGKGEGVTQSYQEALKWWKLAAAKGDAEAQYNIGVMYDKGQGVTQDYKEALKWWRLAAAQGFASAQYHIGAMYYHGQGITQSYQEALKWWKLAAAQGQPNAIENLKLPEMVAAAQNSPAEKTQRIANKPAGKSIPPQLTFSSSAPKSDGTVELSGRVISDASISEISINGRALEVSLGRDNSFKVTRLLPMGSTTYRLSATDEFGLKTDATVTVERAAAEYIEQVTLLDPRKMKAKGNQNAVALIIGVETYSNLPKAQYAGSDANHFYNYANQSLGVPPNKIKLLTDSKASRIELLKAMRSWMRTTVVSGKSDVYIFFAGHGLASADGNKTYLLPADGDRDLLDETSILRDDLIASAKGAKTITMFLDTCYSGGTRTNEVLLADARPIAIVPDKSALPPNVTVLAAASGAQLSSTYEEAQQGLFSYWLMKGLEGDADTNKDKKITTGELHEYVAKQVGPMAQRRNRQQDPQLMGDSTRVLVSY